MPGPERIDILRSRVDALNTAETAAEVHAAYSNLEEIASLRHIDNFSKQEKLLLRKGYEDNRKKIEEHIINTQLVSLDALEQKLEQLSTIDFGDHVADAGRQGMEFLGSSVEAGQEFLEQARKGGGISLAATRDLFKEQAKEHPTRTMILTAVGGAIVATALLKVFNWVTEIDRDSEERSTPRRIFKALGLGAVTAGALALMGINAKEVVAEQSTASDVAATEETEEQPAESTAEPEEQLPSADESEVTSESLSNRVAELATREVISADEIQNILNDPALKQVVFSAPLPERTKILLACLRGSQDLSEKLAQASKHWNGWARWLVNRKFHQLGLSTEEGSNIMEAYQWLQQNRAEELV